MDAHVSGGGSDSVRLVACYRNSGRVADGDFLLEESAILTDLTWRLIIDWGPGTRSWKHQGTRARSKPVLAVAERSVDVFPGFENVVLLSFAELEQVVAEPRRYALCCALSRERCHPDLSTR